MAGIGDITEQMEGEREWLRGAHSKRDDDDASRPAKDEPVWLRVGLQVTVGLMIAGLLGLFTYAQNLYSASLAANVLISQNQRDVALLQQTVLQISKNSDRLLLLESDFRHDGKERLNYIEALKDLRTALAETRAEVTRLTIEVTRLTALIHQNEDAALQRFYQPEPRDRLK